MGVQITSGRCVMLSGNFAARLGLCGVVALGVIALTQILATQGAAGQTKVSIQPFAQQVRAVETSLAYLGQPLTLTDHEAINEAMGDADEGAAVNRLQQIL